MTITINGESKTTSAPTVTALVRELGLPPETILIEHNATALHRSEWDATVLAADDRLEFLRVAAGG